MAAGGRRTKGQYEDRGACDALRNRPRLNAAKSSRCTWNQRQEASCLEKSTEIIFALCKSAWLLENAFASNSSAACLRCRSLSEPGTSCRSCSRRQLDNVTVGARAQASTSLHLLRSANDCWCSTKPCLDRCAITPSDKHMEGHGVPKCEAGGGGHCYQPSRSLSLAVAVNLGYPFTSSASGEARCSLRLSAWIPRVLFATGHGQPEAAQDETSLEGATSRACRPGG